MTIGVINMNTVTRLDSEINWALYLLNKTNNEGVITHGPKFLSKYKPEF